MTALVRNPAHGSDPVLKYDSPLITLKMASCGATKDATAAAQAMPTAISMGRQRSANSVERNDARLKNTAATTKMQTPCARASTMLNCWPIDGARIGMVSGGTIEIAASSASPT